MLKRLLLIGKERKQERMNFGEALMLLKAGQSVSRAGWNGKGMYLELQRPDAHSKMTLPYIYLKTADNQRVPWLASQTDMLAEDWDDVTRLVRVAERASRVTDMVMAWSPWFGSLDRDVVYETVQRLVLADAERDAMTQRSESTKCRQR